MAGDFAPHVRQEQAAGDSRAGAVVARAWKDGVAWRHAEEIVGHLCVQAGILWQNGIAAGWARRAADTTSWLCSRPYSIFWRQSAASVFWILGPAQVCWRR